MDIIEQNLFRRLGMIKYTQKHTDATYDVAEYIVDTYDECIDDMNFTDFIRNKVLVLNRDVLQKDFDDLMMTTSTNDLSFVAELMAMLDIGEFYEWENECIFTTLLEKGDKEKIKNRQKINYIGICMEYERLATLVEFEIVQDKDVESCKDIILQYGVNIQNCNNASEVLDRLGQIFGFF